jgi:hypothetical protein
MLTPKPKLRNQDFYKKSTTPAALGPVGKTTGKFSFQKSNL